MNPIHQAIRIARQRMLSQSLVEKLSLAWLGALGIEAIWLTATRLAGWSPARWVEAIPLSAATLMAIGWTIRRRPDDHAVAVQIDQRLGLKDHLASALYAQTNPTASPMTQAIVQAAQQTASTANIQPAFPIRATRATAWLPVAILAVVSLMLWLPSDWLGLAEQRAIARQQKEQQQMADEQAKEQVAQAAKQLKELGALDKKENLNDLSAQALAKELEELNRQDLSNPNRKQQALVTLSDAQQRLTESIDQKQQQLQTMENALGSLKNDRPGPADRFAESLQRGDFTNALKELQKLANDAEKLSPQEREALQQQLQSLADQLAQIAQQQAQQQAAAQQQMQQAMQQQGMSQAQQQQIQQMLQNGASPQQIQQALQNQGMNPQQAQQLSQQLAQSQQQCQNCNKTGQGTNQLSQGLNQMSGPSGSQSQNGQPGMNGSQQSLAQMSQMQQQLQQMKKAQSQAQQAMQNLSGQPNNAQSGMGQNPGQGGQGGSQAGTADAKYVLGPERSYTGYQSQGEWESTSAGQGRTIASWLSQDGAVKNEAATAYQTALKQAQDQAEQAVTEDRVPTKYHQTIKEYFNQLPPPPPNSAANSSSSSDQSSGQPNRPPAPPK